MFVFQYFFLLLDGELKYYEKEIKGTTDGQNLKGKINLTGSSIVPSAGAGSDRRKYTISSPLDRKKGQPLEFVDTTEAEKWIAAIQSAVYALNFEALVNGSRIPEVIIIFLSSSFETNYWLRSMFPWLRLVCIDSSSRLLSF